MREGPTNEKRAPALAAAVRAFEFRRDVAARALADIVHQQLQGQQKLDQLKGYGDEIAARWGVRSGEPIDLAVLGQFHGFMERLLHAQNIQVDVLERMALKVQAAERTLGQAKTRLRTLELLLERRRQTWARQAARASQRETDELAARYQKVTATKGN